MTEQGVAFCARLMRSHSVEGFKRKRTLPLLLSTAAMFGVPALVLEHIENIHVDGIVNSLDIRQFVDRFNDDNLKHSTLAGVIMAVDASILAIPDIGSQVITRTLCVAARHFGEMMTSLEFASQHLNNKCTRVAVIYSAPSLLRTTRLSCRNLHNPGSFFNDDSSMHDRCCHARRFLRLVNFEKEEFEGWLKTTNPIVTALYRNMLDPIKRPLDWQCVLVESKLSGNPPAPMVESNPASWQLCLETVVKELDKRQPGSSPEVPMQVDPPTVQPSLFKRPHLSPPKKKDVNYQRKAVVQQNDSGTEPTEILAYVVVDYIQLV
ncbi:hypothetical protein EV702DRAFT_1052685 [Suillus placidus]|uniref:Uncharacterized protein n=1 Tax=Suillus placidus TaxID=48579 RepID=A0A9P6ZEY7_9AGAM|nr:hypothetical protein EV702DRAFT_1052685 [Suillus placidus]